jgi:F420-non-reducing hydrogenase small subunit
MSQKPKIALYWCSSCGGCEESVIDLAEDILTIAADAEIIFWPVAIDVKYRHVETLKDNEITAALVNGAVRMDEQEKMVRLLRRKSKLLIAHGSCAHLGGVVGLANFFTKDEVLGRSYREGPTVTNPENILPRETSMVSGREIHLSGFHDAVRALDQVVTVDYYIPGCPPPPELVKHAIMSVLQDELPPSGSVLAEKKALCASCPRKDSMPDKIRVKGFKRVFQTTWDPEICFLPQEIICLGPATRGGCGATCIRGNMPCRGCFGPTENVKDHGAKIVSFLATIIDTRDEEELRTIADSIPDPAGLFYRYSLAVSMLGKRVDRKKP